MIHTMKFRIFLLLLLLCIIFSGCANSNNEILETTTNTETTEAPTIEVTEVENITADDLYGYYSVDGYYIKIDKDIYESKSISNGFVLVTETIKKIDFETLSDGRTKFSINFEGNSLDTMNFFLNKDKQLCDENGTIYQNVQKEQYDSKVFTEPTTEPESTNKVNDYWYEDVFETNKVKGELNEINNLFATGKDEQAISMIDEKIFDNLDRKVDEFIENREFWIAQNYVAMYNAYLGINNELFGVSYPFVSDYFEDVYREENNKFYEYSKGLTALLQEYYLKIAQAAYSDDDCLSRMDSLYLLNEFFIENGQNPVNGLFSKNEYYMYFYDTYDSNFSNTGYFIVCPYNKKIYYVTNQYYFLDNGLILDRTVEGLTKD